MWSVANSLTYLCSLAIIIGNAMSFYEDDMIFDYGDAMISGTYSAHLFDNNHRSLLLMCSDPNFKYGYVDCSQNEYHLTPGYCVTYSENKGMLSIFRCPNAQHNVTINDYTKLPRHLSQLNNFTCGQLNRKGFLCSECADGFGLSVTSFGYKCVNCTDAWYGLLLNFLEFVPVTIFYFIVLMFQISLTSAPMPCFIMYAQIIVIGLNLPPTGLYQTFTDSWQLGFPVDVNVMLMLYGLFNLDFSRNNILPPYCVSSKIKPLHIVLLGYVSIFYPILLIFLTWVSIELHGRNFRPLVWLWRPFHRCFVQLRRGWNTKSDIIDVFTTFFFLSYDKLLFQSSMLAFTRTFIKINPAGKPSIDYGSMLAFKSIREDKRYLGLIIPAFILLFTFNFLPPLLLTLYPIRAFRSCLSNCHLTLNIFIEKVHGCYKNGLDGGQDMRSFSGLYFFLRMMILLILCLSHAFGGHHISQWYSVGILLLITTVAIALAKPYRKTYMNYLDTSLLSIFTILCFTVSLRSEWYAINAVARILLASPLVVTISFLILRKITNLLKKFRSRRTPPCIERSLSSTPTASQSMRQPTSSALSYGTMA